MARYTCRLYKCFPLLKYTLQLRGLLRVLKQPVQGIILSDFHTFRLENRHIPGLVLLCIKKIAQCTKICALTNDLWDTTAQSIEAFNPGECQNFFAAAGYDQH